MSFDIGSVHSLQVAGAAAAPQATAKTAPASGDASDAVKVDTIPSSPPKEVLDAMGTAATAWEKLAATDRGLSFHIDEATGKVVISVHDANGKVLFTLPPSKALEIAGGGSLEQ